MFKGIKVCASLDVYYPLRNHKSTMNFLSLFAFPYGYLVWYTINYHGSRKGPKEVGEALWMVQTLCEFLEYGFLLGAIGADGGLADEWYAATGRNKKGEQNGKDLNRLVDDLMSHAPDDNETAPSYVKLMSYSSRIPQYKLEQLFLCASCSSFSTCL